MAARNLPPGESGGFLGLKHLAAIRANLLGFCQSLAAKHGDICHFKIGPVMTFQVSHPDVYHEVYVSKARSFHKPKRTKQVLGRWNGNGLLLNEGDSWARQRRLVQQAFMPRLLGGYAEISIQRAEKLLAQHGAGQDFELTLPLNRLTLLVVAEALFGEDLDREAEEFFHAVQDLQEIAIVDFLSGWVRPTWWPTPNRARLRKAMNFLDQLVWKMVHARRSSGKDKGDLLSKLLFAVDETGDKHGMTDRQARDEAVNLLLAGNETTATAITWSCYHLTQNLAAQARLHQELDRILGDRQPTAADYSQLEWTTAVFEEAMRLTPPVYVTSREVIEPVEIGGYAMRPGEMVQMVPYITHHDARWFSEPEAFQPERFLPTAEPPVRHAFIPFGAGPRACIGKNLAMLEGVLVLATLLRKHRIVLANDQGPVELEGQISLHPKGGMRVRLEPRERLAVSS
jgi:cytochrome P450